MKITVFLVVMAGVILALILLLIALGRLASRWIARHSRNSQLIRRVTTVQTLQYAILVAGLMFVTAIGQLHPTSTVGELLAFPRGIILVMVLFWLIAIVFGICVLLHRRSSKKHRGGV